MSQQPGKLTMTYRENPLLGVPFGWPTAFEVGDMAKDFGCCIANTEAKAKRISLALNACRNVSADRLAGLDVGALVEERGRLQQENDDLRGIRGNMARDLEVIAKAYPIMWLEFGPSIGPLWESMEVIKRYHDLFRPMTDAEAQQAYDAQKDAPPLSEEEVERIMAKVLGADREGGRP